MIRANKLRIDTTVNVKGEAVKICAITKKKIGFHKNKGVKSLTLAQFKELSNAQQMDGTIYHITDKPTEETDITDVVVKYISNSSGLTYAPLKDVMPIMLSVEYFESLGYEHTVWEKTHNSCEEDTSEFGPIIEMQSPDKRIIVNNMSNRPTPYDWYVHVDNNRMETIGGLDVAYVHEFEGFLIDHDYDIKKEIDYENICV